MSVERPSAPTDVVLTTSANALWKGSGLLHMGSPFWAVEKSEHSLLLGGRGFTSGQSSHRPIDPPGHNSALCITAVVANGTIPAAASAVNVADTGLIISVKLYQTYKFLINTNVGVHPLYKSTLPHHAYKSIMCGGSANCQPHKFVNYKNSSFFY